jgi:outer membrane lipoprotein SlyB
MRKRLIGVPLALALLASCGHPASETYLVSEVGHPVEISSGTVLNSRLVRVQGEGNLIGPAGGAALGAASTSLGGGNDALLVIGGLFGAGLGYLAQRGIGSREGIEYLVELEDGRTVTLVQNRGAEEEPLPSGTPVLIQVGSSYTRVIRDPRPEDARRARGGSGDVWIDPDAPAGFGGGVESGSRARTPVPNSPYVPSSPYAAPSREQR